MPQSDYTSKKSLQSFISQYEEQQSYNETDLTQLGVDTTSTQPLLPSLQTVLSDLPMGMKSSIQTPQWYKDVKQSPDLKQVISLFGTQTLFFIFYACSKKEMNLAANELKKRGYTYIPETNQWRSPNGSVWNISNWKLEEADQ